MNDDLPLYEPELDAAYQLEIVARITGISEQAILEYQEEGLISPRDESGNFTEETVLTLRRIEHLQGVYQTSLPELKLILGLLEQIELLQSEIRARR